MGLRNTECIAQIVAVHLGHREGVFGLHLKLEMSPENIQDFSLTEMDEIENLLVLFRVQRLEQLTGRKVKYRQYPNPAAGKFPPTSNGQALFSPPGPVKAERKACR